MVRVKSVMLGHHVKATILTPPFFLHQPKHAACAVTHSNKHILLHIICKSYTCEQCRFHAVRTAEVEHFEVGHVLELVGDCSAAVSFQPIPCTHHTLLLFQRLLLDGRSVESKQIAL